MGLAETMCYALMEVRCARAISAALGSQAPTTRLTHAPRPRRLTISAKVPIKCRIVRALRRRQCQLRLQHQCQHLVKYSSRATGTSSSKTETALLGSVITPVGFRSGRSQLLVVIGSSFQATGVS